MNNKKRNIRNAGEILRSHTIVEHEEPIFNPSAERELNLEKFRLRNSESMAFICRELLHIKYININIEYAKFSSLNYDQLSYRGHVDNVHVLIDTEPIFAQHFEGLKNKPYNIFSPILKKTGDVLEALAVLSREYREDEYLVGIEDLLLLAAGTHALSREHIEGADNTDRNFIIPGILIRAGGKWSVISIQIKNKKLAFGSVLLSKPYDSGRDRFMTKKKNV